MVYKSKPAPCVVKMDEILCRGLEDLGVSEFCAQIWQYVQLLKHWNQAYSLVARGDEPVLYARHIFDSLSVRSFISGSRLLDVGTGAGLPGLLLAVTMPGQNWTLLDANGKKTRFCEQAVLELGLKNVIVIQQRIEDHQLAGGYETIISRAYGQASDFVAVTSRLKCVGGQILAMKGKINKQEQMAAESTGLCLDIMPLQVPTLVGQRHLMVFR